MLKSLTLTLALVFLSASAHAEVLMENLTWIELRDQIVAGSTTVIVPIGGTEQSGPHLAFGKQHARVSFVVTLIDGQQDRRCGPPTTYDMP